MAGPLGRTPLPAPALAHGSGCCRPHPESASARPSRWGLVRRGRSRPLRGRRRPLALFQLTQDLDASPLAGLCEQWSRGEQDFCDIVSRWKGQKSAGRSLCSQVSTRITSSQAQISGAGLQPGRAGSAQRLRGADAKSPGPPPALMRAHVGLCARWSAFVEPWPRWAYRPSRTRAGPGAGAIARAAPAPGRVHRSTGSEL